jgi:hypothetical protein
MGGHEQWARAGAKAVCMRSIALWLDRMPADYAGCRKRWGARVILLCPSSLTARQHFAFVKLSA